MSTATITSTAAPRARSNHRAAFWSVAYAFAAMLAFSAVPTPLYGIYQHRDGFSSFAVTVIFAAYAVGVVISLFTVGHLSDWHGRRRLMVPALAAGIVSAVVFLAWKDLPGLIMARVIGGLGVGAITPTATAWLAELHGTDRPRASVRRAQIVATAANLGGIGIGPLVSGALAQWVAAPLTVPYVVCLVALIAALALVAISPETREPIVPRPRYRAQRVAVPADARTAYIASGIAAAIAFAAFGLFTSLAPTFLADTLHRGSHLLAGASAFSVFAAAVLAQSVLAAQPARTLLRGGIAGLLTGLGLLVAAVWLGQPSLALFVIGGVIAGAGAGTVFKGAVATVSAMAVPARRAEALAGMFLAGYAGLSVPVLGLGILTQYASARVSLLAFAGFLTAVLLPATPALVGAQRPAVSTRSGT